MAGRGLWLAGECSCLNVRRLMYQSLIWLSVLDHEARRLGAALDTEDLECAADALVDGVRRNPELDRDFLRRTILGDEAQAGELAAAELVDR